jgi:hypothetical protein
MPTDDRSCVAYLMGRARAMHKKIEGFMQQDWPLVKKVKYSHTAMLEFVVAVEWEVKHNFPDSVTLKNKLADAEAAAARTWARYVALQPRGSNLIAGVEKVTLH